MNIELNSKHPGVNFINKQLIDVIMRASRKFLWELLGDVLLNFNKMLNR